MTTGLPHEFFVRLPGETTYRCEACGEPTQNLRERMAHASSFRNPRPVGGR